MLRTAITITVLLAAVLGSGCSYYTAAIPPRPRNLALLAPGTPRTVILAEFGEPIVTDIRDGRRREIVRFIHGPYAPPSSTVATLYDTAVVAAEGTANVATLGAWSGPHPPALMGADIMVELIYSREDVVVSVVPLHGGELLASGGPGVAYK
ncbi:MAG: hypothetical protein WC807_06265 [Hyphomicrobium sp.]|jgi:hypothetical protein